MSRRGRLISVCLLASVAVALSQIVCGSATQAARSDVSLMKGSTVEQIVRGCSGLRNAPGEERLSADELNRVLLSLREKTGWQSLAFDERGFLVCPEPESFRGGSEAARRLLGAALFGEEVYHLEAHNRSQSVMFARLAEGVHYRHVGTGAELRTRRVQIDFIDFNQVRGHGAARRAFDPGLIILHELAHGIWNLHDAKLGQEEPGECERFINLIRRQLQLPERESYLAQVRLCISCAGVIVELRFTRTVNNEGQSRKRRFVLRWEADTVGATTLLGQGLSAPGQVSGRASSTRSAPVSAWLRPMSCLPAA